MIRNSLFISTIVMCVALFELLDRLHFLAPYKNTLFVNCGPSLALFFGALGLNLFAGILAINRQLLLKDTGRKLSHIDKQLQAEGTEILPRFFGEPH